MCRFYIFGMFIYTLNSFSFLKVAQSETKYSARHICLAHKQAKFHANFLLTRGPCKSSGARNSLKGICSLPERVGGGTTGSEGGCLEEWALWQISPAKTFSIICVILTLEQKHDLI